jgi:DNA-binding transcriptional ArsR family regulator
MEDKIVLDRKSFEALAVDTRVRILKSLKQRRKTLSEIAEEQKMSVSGRKEHLSVLEKVGLIEKFDDGHKWKYYELTKKGREIVGPKELKVWILLSMSTLALIASVFMMFSVPLAVNQGPIEDTAMPPAEALGGEKDLAMYVTAEAPTADAMPENDTGQIAAEEAAPGTSVLMVAAISTVVVIGCLGILLRNRLSTSP